MEILSYHIARSFHFPFLLFHFQVEFTNDLVILDFPRFLILKAKEEWYLHQDDIFEVAHTQQLHIVPETSSNSSIKNYRSENTLIVITST